MVYISCEGRGKDWILLFASLLMSHCSKLTHSSLPMLTFIRVQFCSRNRTSRSLNPVFFLCFRLFLSRHSALSSFFIHLNLVQKLMIINLMIMLNLMNVCKRSVVHLLFLQSTTQFTSPVIHTSISEGKTVYRDLAFSFSLAHTSDHFSTVEYFIVYSVCHHSPGV